MYWPELKYEEKTIRPLRKWLRATGKSHVSILQSVRDGREVQELTSEWKSGQKRNVRYKQQNEGNKQTNNNKLNTRLCVGIVNLPYALISEDHNQLRVRASDILQ